MNNLVLSADSYKYSHSAWQYPPGMTSMFSYFESRGGKYSSTIFFGLQYLLKKYFTKVITGEMVEEAKEFMALHGLPFDYGGWNYIRAKYGYFPVKIRAIPEGTLVPNHNVLFTVESEDKTVPWITSFIETMLVQLWYPTTVATRSYNIKKLIYKYLKETSDEPDKEIDFKLHDFGYRGVSSQESAEIGGAAHLVNFKGSDTIAGIWAANKYYNEKMSGFSIPAMEHSTVTAWGQENELEAYRNMLNNFAKPESILACVSDSYDLWNVIDNFWGGELKQQIIDSGATLVVRPDSGNPKEIVVKTAFKLSNHFGSTVNSKGFIVINNVRIVQGDGISENSIQDILLGLEENGFSATNIAFGMGGGLLQDLNRDTNKFAYKCSSVTVDGEERDVFKEPVTDLGKISKAGRLDLRKNIQGGFETKKLKPGQERLDDSALVTVYEKGQIVRDYTFQYVRDQVKKYFISDVE